MTSIVPARTGRASGRVWLLDLAAFLSALFTYDQAFFAVLSAVVVRLRIASPRGFLLAHAPFAAAVAFFLWLKLTAAPASGPALRHDSAGILLRNAATTFFSTLKVSSFCDCATRADWLLALAAATMLTAAVQGHMTGILPLLLGEAPGSGERELTLRLVSFPETDRVRLTFYQTGPEQAPARLGAAEAAVGL